MTYNEIINIAKRLDEETRERIDEEVAERLEILKLGDLNEEQMESMEECLYMSLVIQEYLDGEYELIDEERAFLLEEMAELYGEYNDLLLKAKLEEKVSKKKRLALELMRIREKLFDYKDQMKDVKKSLQSNRDNKKQLEDLSSKKKMKEVAKENKKGKIGLDLDTKIGNDSLKRGNDIDTGKITDDVINTIIASGTRSERLAEALGVGKQDQTVLTGPSKEQNVEAVQNFTEQTENLLGEIPLDLGLNYDNNFAHVASANGYNDYQNNLHTDDDAKKNKSLDNVKQHYNKL